MEIRVEGSLDQAMRVLKRKLAKEGVFKEMKKRAFYEKPSVRRKRKRSEAQRRRGAISGRAVPALQRFRHRRFGTALWNQLCCGRSEFRGQGRTVGAGGRRTHSRRDASRGGEFPQRPDQGGTAALRSGLLRDERPGGFHLASTRSHRLVKDLEIARTLSRWQATANQVAPSPG